MLHENRHNRNSAYGCGGNRTARINADLAGGGAIAGWRAGWTNISPGKVFSTSWNQAFPAAPSLVGPNSFPLLAEDVTPPPYNQPPCPASGATDTSACTVEGIVP